MSEPILDHPAYIEILMSLREHMSLTRVSQYLESKPQNVSGWLNTKSVPTLKSFRERILELAYFLKYIADLPLKLGPTASQLLDQNAPTLPPWGISTSTEGLPQAVVVDAIERPLERWSWCLVNNVREFLPKTQARTSTTRSPDLTWKKLALLKQLYQEERPRHGQTDNAKNASSCVLIWGESCAGKSTLANQLLGANMFSVTPIPEPSELRSLTSDDKVIVEVPAFDGPPPPPQEMISLLRYLLMSPDCRLLIVLSAQNFSTLARHACLTGTALLPVKITVVVSKLDLHATPEDQERVARFLRGRLLNHHVLMPTSLHMGEDMLAELRNAAGLVGTSRIKLIAAASAPKKAQPGNHDLFGIVVAIIQQSMTLPDIPLTMTTTFQELNLSGPAVGQILLAIELKLGVRFSDRDTDTALIGQESLGWLVNIVFMLLDSLSA